LRLGELGRMTLEAQVVGHVRLGSQGAATAGRWVDQNECPWRRAHSSASESKGGPS